MYVYVCISASRSHNDFTSVYIFCKIKVILPYFWAEKDIVVQKNYTWSLEPVSSFILQYINKSEFLN